MKRLLLTALVGLTLAAPLGAFGGVDEIQRQTTWRAHEAKRKQAAADAERQRLMQAHAQLMDDAGVEMRAARPSADMSAQQMREWLDEHLRLMDQLMGRLVEQYRGVTPGAGK